MQKWKYNVNFAKKSACRNSSNPRVETLGCGIAPFQGEEMLAHSLKLTPMGSDRTN
jgi:hypothetical protein